MYVKIKIKHKLMPYPITRYLVDDEEKIEAYKRFLSKNKYVISFVIYPEKIPDAASPIYVPEDANCSGFHYVHNVTGDRLIKYINDKQYLEISLLTRELKCYSYINEREVPLPDLPLPTLLKDFM